MKVLVVGSGGREHAIAWKLLQSNRIKEVICVPGNGGTATLDGCRNLALSIDDHEGIARFALVNNCALVVIGPEQPLADGLADFLQNQDIRVFGPGRAGAQLEASKAWAKAFMAEANIPTAAAESFTSETEALAYVEQMGPPIVVKADGLAAGKGVTVAHSLETAQAAVRAAFDGHFGAAGDRLVIETFMEGQEVSVLAVTDGLTIRPLLPAQDHKPIGEGDTGPNTGGMGAYAPTPLVTPELLQRIQQQILEPAMTTLRQRGIDYRGVLYAGLMITPAGDPKVVEFNCRFGDPETQAVLPLLETPLIDVLLACVEGRLADLPPLQWTLGAAACVVTAAAGYPGSYSKGMAIHGLEAAAESGAVVFHAGTRYEKGQVLAHGGRVLGVTGLGDSFVTAIANAYEAVACLDYEGIYYRRDIGFRVRDLQNVPE
ncbi:phosphoribosylamine--glycine ligase [filamentous cyanobacterium CCP5]|nr:phosphoribosylamine--glycine ligase [filamentous cyanobacterium CCP5]